jgi:hypothetical protein
MPSSNPPDDEEEKNKKGKGIREKGKIGLAGDTFFFLLGLAGRVDLGFWGVLGGAEAAIWIPTFVCTALHNHGMEETTRDGEK